MCRASPCCLAGCSNLLSFLTFSCSRSITFTLVFAKTHSYTHTRHIRTPSSRTATSHRSFVLLDISLPHAHPYSTFCCFSSIVLFPCTIHIRACSHVLTTSTLYFSLPSALSFFFFVEFVVIHRSSLFRSSLFFSSWLSLSSYHHCRSLSRFKSTPDSSPCPWRPPCRRVPGAGAVP